MKFRTFDIQPICIYNEGRRGGSIMARVKKLTFDRYEHRLLVRALHEEWHRMLAEGKPTEDMEALILKVIDAPTKKGFGRV